MFSPLENLMCSVPTSELKSNPLIYNKSKKKTEKKMVSFHHI